MFEQERLKPSNRLLMLSTSQFRREYKSGAVYHGELEGNKRTGKGLFKWPNGACYDGEYMDNMRQGKGKQYFADGSAYEGAFVRDLRHGQGQLSWPDGECYKGSFYRDKRLGSGVYTWPDGTKFEGYFENDRKEGFGVFTFASGNTFEGIYKDDERNGPGILTYTNGTQDVGLWLGEKIIKLCSVMESAFLFQHYSDYNVNAGKNLSKVVRCANSAWESVRSSPTILELDNQDVNRLTARVPDMFPYLDILEGIRGDRGPKGPMECSSEDLLRAAAAGDCIKVKSLLQSECVHVDVADKTGYTALLAAAVNCHRNVINYVLDYGANVNKLNDEGLSVLAACHVLFYTKHTWKDNIAESIPLENLFNSIQEDTQKGSYVHRNFCRNNTSNGDCDNTLGQLEGNVSASDHRRESPDQICTRQEMTVKKSMGNFDNHRTNEDDEIDNENNNRDKLNQRDEKEAFITTESADDDVSMKNFENNRSSGRLTPISDVPSELEKNGNNTSHSLSTNPIVTSLLSVLSVITTTPNVSDAGENSIEHSLEQKKEMLLAMQRRPHLEATVRLLLKRGADPNASSLPMPVLFFAVKAADTAAVEILLQKGANTSAKLSEEKLGIAPLHIAVALPNTAGIEITKLLLKSGADANIRDSAFGDEAGGRTPLHIACSREDNDKDSCAVVQLLLEFGANPDLLCEGFSPLSLAICSGNDLAVDKLLEHGAKPSLKLTMGVGSALCATTSFAAERRRLPNERIRLINKLMRAGANILAPITVNTKYPPGTIIDYAYNVFYQDRKIAHTPYHALTATERDCYNARRGMLEHLGDLLRTQVLKKEKELIDKQLAEMEIEAAEAHSRSPSSPWGILKSPDKLQKLTDGKIPTSRADPSRVTFRVENEVKTAHSNEDDLEVVTADREVEAITGTEDRLGTSPKGTGASPESEDQERPPCSPATQASPSGTCVSSTPLGRDSDCGLRISVVKASDHMSISAVATEALKKRKQVMKNRFRYCYECGRSVGVRLSACTRCKEVFYCSKSCKLKAWNARHREECVRMTGASRSHHRRAESPTPTTDPDAPSQSSTPTHGQHSKNTSPSHSNSGKSGRTTSKDRRTKSLSTKPTRRSATSSTVGKK